MACELTAGRLDFSCKTNVGGLKAIYVMEFNANLINEVAYFENWIDTVSSFNEIYKFELKSDANTFEESNEVSRDNGTSIFTQTGTFQLKRQDKDSQKILSELSKARCQVIIEDHNGFRRLAGLQNGVDFTVGTTTGGALADMNGYNLAFTAVEQDLAPYLQPDVILASDSSSTEGFKITGTDINPNA